VIEPAALLAWSALALAVTLTPGPDTFLVASHGARGGLQFGFAAVAGIVAGAVWYAALFGFGALAILAATPALFVAVKIAGALYLAWLGVQFLQRALGPAVPARKLQAPRIAQPIRQYTLAEPFRHALLTNTLNPKVALFYLAALPQFASGANAPSVGVLLIAIHALFGAIWLSFIAFAASRARAIVWNSILLRWLEGVIGVFFIGVAGRLAIAQR
jgi:threonine/homoserine/homoserine lactone efflux protein